MTTPTPAVGGWLRCWSMVDGRIDRSAAAAVSTTDSSSSNSRQQWIDRCVRSGPACLPSSSSSPHSPLHYTTRLTPLPLDRLLPAMEPAAPRDEENGSVT
eukprot:GHVU01039352.1.p5 GENE.GHVU01039352.1~~GHVU01039352.1.p5  ORF type:complete len:100 (+),score=16.74 GHVU01039352.1:690-989(+)